jgi:peptide/nickel transport system substrate-binding protein
MLKIKNLKKGFYALSKKERVVVYIFSVLLFLSFFSMINNLNNKLVVPVPEDGGSITEGIIGTPTLINPVLAVTDADKDITALVYSGLMRKSQDGGFIPDLAESYTVSPEGNVYTFTLKDNLTFHDGSKLSASDIVFTINQIQDPLIKSPKKTQWEGVTVQEVDPKTIVFTLKQPYISFLDNATIGILPMNIWKNITPAEFGLNNLNTKGIGTGPYMINGVETGDEGIPNVYNLSRFKKFALGAPHIKKITIKLYANEKELIQALKSGDIKQAGGISPSFATTIKARTSKIVVSTLPRTFGLFFNTSQNKIFVDNSIRNALDMGIDRQGIINQVLKSYGDPIDSPIPDILFDKSVSYTHNYITDKEKAIDILEKAGWKVGIDGIREKGAVKNITTGKGKSQKTVQVASGPKTRLSFTLTTGDAPELVETAEIIKNNLNEIGIEVDIKIYETGALNQIIRARNYEVLLFGQVINHESDMFAFWHSSQKTDPGLNIALYENKESDTILEQIQKIQSVSDRQKKYTQLESILQKDKPAVFIYSPEYIYATSKNLNLPNNLRITLPGDRFNSVYTWYTESDKVWKIFIK